MIETGFSCQTDTSRSPVS